ncbi:hypothetical protein TL16_g05750 [Triparma laevis f. inornata]|nr:hypothetical protein TL16_g05750 [Triparma laevis f. inornata]GMI12481.1 hypothetical protein TrLO_g2952 [Triparma laevis f. longispina]
MSAPPPPHPHPSPSLLIPTLSPHSSLTWHPTPPPTRTSSDFTLLHPLSSGSFGRTFKVLHNLDSRIYALKSIAEPGEDSLKEVEALSFFESRYIVRYYGAWIEPASITEFGVSDPDTGSWSTSTSTSTKSLNDYTCTCDVCKTSYIDWEIELSKWGLLSSILRPLNLCQTCYLNSIPEEER